ncbi:hypothetical protein IJ556_02295, partial [bacterium]|nr:hypothetical protein [bacterium]
TTFANTPKENLPEGYNPHKVFDNGKSIGLGIDKVHNMGYTGQGVSYVIIDSCPLDSNGQQHADIHYKEYYGESQGSIYNNHHGRAVSYIAQEIAPDADCYFYSDSNDDYNRAILDDLKEILVKNKSLPDNQKIRFISHSGPISQGEEEKQIIAELEAQGIWVFYSGCPEDIKYHGYLTKIDPQGSSDDFNNYQIGYLRGMRIQADGSIVNQDYNDILFVNSGNRTVPDHTSLTGYRHDSRASQSWSIPVLAGYYTLACQADPKMTKEKFLQMADKTAYIKETTIPIYKEIEGKENAEYVGQTKETVQIKIIDINALLQAIEAEKSQ